RGLFHRPRRHEARSHGVQAAAEATPGGEEVSRRRFTAHSLELHSPLLITGRKQGNCVGGHFPQPQVGSSACPGRSAPRSGALQTRDRSSPWRSRISDAPLRCACAASHPGHTSVGRVRSLIHLSNSPSRSRDAVLRGLHRCFAHPNRGVGGAPIRHPYILTSPQVAPGYFKGLAFSSCAPLTLPLPSSGYIGFELG